MPLISLDTGLKDVNWLQSELPPGIKLIVSFKRDHADADAEKLFDRLKDRGDLLEIKPFDSAEDRKKLIDKYLEQYLKKLDPKHIDALLEIEASKNPLFLKIVLNELRIFGAFLNIKEKIRNDFGNDPQSAFAGVLKRLETDPAYTSVPPKISVPLIFGLLAHSRHGLSADELAHMLLSVLGDENNGVNLNDLKETVSLYLRQVRIYLARKEGRYDFYYESFKVVAGKRYAKEESIKQICDFKQKTKSSDLKSGILTFKTKDWHMILADCFRCLADPSNDQQWKGKSARSFLELPFHLSRSDEVQLHELLWNPYWYSAKLRHTDVYELILDLSLIPQDKDLCLVRDAVSLSANVLTGDRMQLASQLAGRLLVCEAPRIVTLVGKIIKAQTNIWLQLLSPSLAGPFGPLKRTLEGHTSAVHSVAVTEDGKVVSGGADNSIKVWDLSSGKLLRTLKGHNSSINTVTVSVDGKVVSGGADNSIMVWDLSSGKLLRTMKGHNFPINTVAVTASGMVVSGSQDHTLRVWDLASGNLLHTLEGHTQSVNSLVVTPDGKVVSGSRDNTVKVWDLASGQLLRTIENELLKMGSITAVALTIDGKLVYSSGNTCIEVEDFRSGEWLSTLIGHKSTIFALALTNDGKVVSGSSDNTIKVWDLASGELLQTLNGHNSWVLAVAVTANGMVISGSEDKTLKVWDCYSHQNLRTTECHSGAICAVTLTPDGKVVSGSSDNTVKVWNLASGKLLSTLRGHGARVAAVAVTAGGMVVSGSYDKTLKVWDISSGQLLRTLEGHTDEVSCVAVTADDKVVSGSWDETLKVWDINSGKLLLTLDFFGESQRKRFRKMGCRRDIVWSVAVTDDNKVISVNNGGYPRVWDLTSGKLLRNITDHGYSYGDFAVAVTAGSLAVSGSGDKTLKVWDIGSGKLMSTLRGHGGRVAAVAVTADGMVISGSDDKTLKVWDLVSGKVLATFVGEHSFHACTVDRNQHSIVVGDEGGQLHFLQLVFPDHEGSP